MTEKQSLRDSDWLPNISLGFSLLAGLLFLMPYFALPLALTAIVCGFVSSQNSSKNTAGIILGFVQIPVHVVMLIILFMYV